MNQNHIKELSIQISLSGLSFCILNRSTKTVEFLLNKPFDKRVNPFELLDYLKEGLTSHSQLNQQFSSVLVIYQNELSNLVPKIFFDEENAADYLKFNSKILTSDFISHDEMTINDSVNVYVPYMNINNFIFETFGVFEYKHASTILMSCLLGNVQESDAPVLYVNVNHNHFELVAIKNSKLLLYNSFEFSTKEDLIYYVLFTMEQLQLNPETTNLKLMGLIEKGDSLYTIIYTYIRFVAFYLPAYKFDFLPEMNPRHKHQDAIILNSFL